MKQVEAVVNSLPPPEPPAPIKDEDVWLFGVKTQTMGERIASEARLRATRTRAISTVDTGLSIDIYYYFSSLGLVRYRYHTKFTRQQKRLLWLIAKQIKPKCKAHLMKLIKKFEELSITVEYLDKDSADDKKYIKFYKTYYEGIKTLKEPFMSNTFMSLILRWPRKKRLEFLFKSLARSLRYT